MLKNEEKLAGQNKFDPLSIIKCKYILQEINRMELMLSDTKEYNNQNLENAKLLYNQCSCFLY